MRIRPIPVAAAALAALAATPVASAERALGIVSPSTLVAFDTATPNTATITKIINLGPGETVLGIDYRPATGQVMIWTVPIGSVGSAPMKVYFLDPATGIATVVGTTPVTTASPPGAADVKTGFDFNPLVDRTRVIPSNNENFRINPNNGTLAGDDTNLTYSAGIVGPIIEVAYDRNVAPGPPGTPIPPGWATTLYAISRGDSKLGIVGGINGAPSPNGGVVTAIGNLGVTLSAGTGAGFDISGKTGIAYAALTTSVGTGFYTINLTSGVASLHALMPPVARLDGLTIAPDTAKPVGLLGAPPIATPRNLKRRTWRVSFSSNEAVTAKSTLTARVSGHRRTLGKGTASLGAAGIGKIGAPLTTAGRNLVAKMSRRIGAQTQKATLTVVLTDLAGNTRTLRASITIRG